MTILNGLLTLTLVAACGTAGAAACSDAAQDAGWVAPGVESATGALLDMDALEAELATRRVVYVAEAHDRFDHHLNQLEIVCRMARHGPIAVGMEFFQTPAQSALDAYVNEHGDLQRLLRESEWFDRWRYDPRLYAPILRFARQHRIPLVALNVPGELVRKVARDGSKSLTKAERARLPGSIREGPPAYRERLMHVFEQHPHGNARNFDDFLQAQLLWDEGMAQNAADYLLAHPRRRLVVLAGEGHIAHRDPIPDRVQRRVNVTSVSVLQSHGRAAPPDAGDFRLDTAARELPAAGLLGVRVKTTHGAVRIDGFGKHSAARDAGLLEGDVITALDGRPVKEFADLRLLLWQKAPGEAVQVSVSRDDAGRTVVLALR